MEATTAITEYEDNPDEICFLDELNDILMDPDPVIFKDNMPMIMELPSKIKIVGPFPVTQVKPREVRGVMCKQYAYYLQVYGTGLDPDTDTEASGFISTSIHSFWASETENEDEYQVIKRLDPPVKYKNMTKAVKKFCRLKGITWPTILPLPPERTANQEKFEEAIRIYRINLGNIFSAITDYAIENNKKLKMTQFPDGNTNNYKIVEV